jgi:hypothetical protein
MRKQRPPKKAPKQQPRDPVFIDRSPAKDKLNLDLDIAVATASEHGLTSADIIELMMLRVEQIAVLAKERGDDLSSLNTLLFGEEDAAA